MNLRRARFGELIGRQLDLFEQDNADVLRDVEKRRSEWNAAAREDAEKLYGDYLDAVETGTELLADVRDHFARSLSESDAERYRSEFDKAVFRRLRPFALEIENR
jgi:isocitrate dehydrogenase kinase/phosphatase